MKKTAEPAPMNIGALLLTPEEKHAINELTAHCADNLRSIAVALGGMVEHHSECGCPIPHDALILAIPEPYLTHFKQLWPAMRDEIDQRVAGSQPVTTKTLNA